MRTRFAFFAASRYWQDTAALQQAYTDMCGLFANDGDCALVVDGEGAGNLAADLLVIVPMSGAVQKYILQAAAGARQVVLYAAYMRGNASAEAELEMLRLNAAPTLMDSWAVLRQTHPAAHLALSAEELAGWVRAIGAYFAVRGAKLLLVGEPEPWVISASRSLEKYRALGVEIEQVAQDILAKRYAATTPAEGERFYQKYMAATRVVEPSDEDVRNASRMAAALSGLLEERGADGVAIACFDLLKTGTNACLGVSYINDCTDKIAACEGDLDSAFTMLALKKLGTPKLWMANPGLHPGGIVNFSHCTAPLDFEGTGDRPFVLRSHHESGIGASLEVDMPAAKRVSACRVSAESGAFTVQGGESHRGEPEPCCRTQLYLKFDDFGRYIDTALGCHQVLCFGDITQDAVRLFSLFGLRRL